MRGAAPGSDQLRAPGFVGAGGGGLGPRPRRGSGGAGGQRPGLQRFELKLRQPQPQIRPRPTPTATVNNAGIFPSTFNNPGELMTLTSGIHADNIKNAFGALLSTGYATTVTVNCKGVGFLVHRFILQNCSGYFGTQFAADDDEGKEDPSSDANVSGEGAQRSRSNVVFLNNDEISPDIFRHILEYMYVGQLTLSKDKIPAFLKAGEILKVKGLYKSSGGQGQVGETKGDGNGNREEKDKTENTSKEGEGQSQDRVLSPMLPPKKMQFGLICDPPPRPRPPAPMPWIHPQHLAFMRMTGQTPYGGGFYGYGVPYPYQYQSPYLAQWQYQAFLAQQRAMFYPRPPGPGPSPAAANANANVRFQRFANAPAPRANIPMYFGGHPRPFNLVPTNNGNETRPWPRPMMTGQSQAQQQHQQQVKVQVKQQQESESESGRRFPIIRRMSLPKVKSQGPLQEGHSQNVMMPMMVKEELKSDLDEEGDANNYGGLTITQILGPDPASIPQWSGLRLPVGPGAAAVHQGRGRAGRGQPLQLPKPNSAPEEPKPAKKIRK